MEIGDKVIVFKTYDLLTDNIIDLLFEDRYNIGVIFSMIERKGSIVLYARDLKKSVNNEPVVYVTKAPLTAKDYTHTLLSVSDVFAICDKFAIKNSSFNEAISDLKRNIIKLTSDAKNEVVT